MTADLHRAGLIGARFGRAARRLKPDPRAPVDAAAADAVPADEQVAEGTATEVTTEGTATDGTATDERPAEGAPPERSPVPPQRESRRGPVPPLPQPQRAPVPPLPRPQRPPVPPLPQPQRVPVPPQRNPLGAFSDERSPDRWLRPEPDPLTEVPAPAAWDEPEIDHEVFSAPTVRVRPYIHTGGRTRASTPLPLESMVCTAPGASALRLNGAHRWVAELCAVPQSVAEVSARLGVPLAVARVVVDDLVEQRMVTVQRGVGDNRPDIGLMKRVLAGLQRL